MMPEHSHPRTAWLLIWLALAFAASACEPVQPPNQIGGSIVTETVLAKDFKADTATPTDITTEFAPEQKQFHLVVTVNDAPKDTKFKSVWTAVEIGGTTLPHTKLEERELIVTGSGTFEFTIAPKTGKWAAGKYKVDLYANNNLTRSINFTVAGTIAARVPTPTPTLVKCPAPTAPVAKPSGLISKVTVSDKIDAFGNPMNPATTFKSVTKIYVVISYRNAPSNTRIKIRWWVLDVGDAAPCNSPLADDENMTVGQTGNMALYFERPKPFPTGMYRVEIYLNDTLDQVANFSVKE